MPTIERPAGNRAYACRCRRDRRHRGTWNLAGALWVGVAAAKALAVGLGKPSTASTTWHRTWPSTSSSMDRFRTVPRAPGQRRPLLAAARPDVTADVRPLGQTIDDAAGRRSTRWRECWLPFPGGPYIDRAAREGNQVAIDFPGLTGVI